MFEKGVKIISLNKNAIQYSFNIVSIHTKETNKALNL